MLPQRAMISIDGFLSFQIYLMGIEDRFRSVAAVLDMNTTVAQQ